MASTYIQQARQLVEQGDKNAAGRLLKHQLDKNFKDTAAWEMLFEWFGNGRTFPDFQARFMKKYYPQLDIAPFCPRCHKTYPEGAQFCGYCGFGVMMGDKPLNYQVISQAAPTSNRPGERVAAPEATAAPLAKPSDKGSTPLWWTLGLGLFIVYVLSSLVGSSGESFDLSEWFFWTSASLWVSSGYVGMVWLFRRGYMVEMLGCMFMAGGAPLWFPIFFGPIILAVAYWLPLYPMRQR